MVSSAGIGQQISDGVTGIAMPIIALPMERNPRERLKFAKLRAVMSWPSAPSRRKSRPVPRSARRMRSRNTCEVFSGKPFELF